MEENTKVNTEEQTSEAQTEEKRFTEEELQQMIEEESEKRIKQALATQEKKFQRKLKLMQLPASERESAEKDELIAELKARVNEGKMIVGKSKMQNILIENHCNPAILDYITVTDDEEENELIALNIVKAFRNDVQKAVEERMKGTTPKASDGSTAISKAEFDKMPIHEQVKFLDRNPHLKNTMLR